MWTIAADRIFFRNFGGWRSKADSWWRGGLHRHSLWCQSLPWYDFWHPFNLLSSSQWNELHIITLRVDMWSSELIWTTEECVLISVLHLSITVIEEDGNPETLLWGLYGNWTVCILQEEGWHMWRFSLQALWCFCLRASLEVCCTQGTVGSQGIASTSCLQNMWWMLHTREGLIP